MRLSPPPFGIPAYPLAPVYEVTREQIRDFADAIGDDNPVYRDPAAARALGYPDVIAPPTFAVAVAMDAGRRIEDASSAPVLHGSQQLSYSRPVVAGDRLLATVRAGAPRSRGGIGTLSLAWELTTEDGELVVSGSAKVAYPVGIEGGVGAGATAAADADAGER
jgi:acyl dehydratase